MEMTDWLSEMNDCGPKQMSQELYSFKDHNLN